jgi:PAS domain S-box-containing protein
MKHNALKEHYFDLVDNMVYFKDTELNFIDCNHHFCQWIGIDENKVVGSHASGLNEKAFFKELDAIEKKVLHTRKKEEGSFGIQISGSKYYFKARIFPIVEEKCITLMCDIQDITASKLRELELKEYCEYQDKMIHSSVASKRESQQRYELLFENAVDAVLIIENGILTDCNQKSITLLGCENRYDIIGKCIDDFSANYQLDGELSGRKIKRLFNDANYTDDQHFEWLFINQQGEEIIADVKHSLVILNNQKLIYIVWRDISEQKALEAQTKQHEMLLIQQSKLASMGEMMGNIAHQWRQPLNVLSLIMMELDDLIEESELNDKNFSDSYVNFNKTVQFMSKTIDDFRMFFLPSKKKELFCIEKTINDIIWMITPQFKSHNIKVNLIQRSQNNRAYGFENEFKQVLINILNNANDAISSISEHNPEYEGEITAYIDNDNEWSIVTIRDNGGGIDSEIIERIFDPYFTTKFEAQGTGLGLYMSKMIIEKNMSGYLNVSSSKEGTSFIIKFPKSVESEFMISED